MQKINNIVLSLLQGYMNTLGINANTFNLMDLFGVSAEVTHIWEIISL